MARRRPQVAVSGGGVDPPGDVLDTAAEVGERLAESGIAVVCGALGGVMEAAARGAAEAGGDVIGIVPSADPADANPYCTHVVASGVGHARNLAVVASGDAVIAIGGEWGTLSEIAFARELGRPVIALRTWTVRGTGPMEDAPGIVPAASPAEAVDAVQRALS
ncbi:MAG TPA: TIGR00725 family protein [Solirubrobacterales bacterium]|nr:TIGR00725 family protein [Solirubrobacterales bacterium]